MSGHASTTKCPNCGKEADLYTDYKPFNYSTINCYECGLFICPGVDYLNLDELNKERKSLGLKPLKRLPKQNKSL
jgi:hypothetical protein